jgi:MFS family permease
MAGRWPIPWRDFPFGLVVSGILSPIVCGLIDRHGGNIVLSSGALAGSLGLALLVIANRPAAYFACWLLIGAAMSATLYDPAFATLARIFGTSARRQITFVTVAGGFASTVGWPATHFLPGQFGWRGTYLVFAAAFALVIAPLHAFALPRCRRSRRSTRPSSRRRRCGMTDGPSCCWPRRLRCMPSCFRELPRTGRPCWSTAD